MRVFGCLAYVRDTNTKGDKFVERGRPGVFIGYPHGQKGYHIVDKESGQIIVSRDVKFVEDVFPFAAGKMDLQDPREDIIDAGVNGDDDDVKYFRKSPEIVTNQEETDVSEGGEGNLKS